MSKRAWLPAGVAVLLALVCPARAQKFPRFIEEVKLLPTGDRQERVNTFLAKAGGFPLTEETSAHFIYTGSDTAVAVAGDFNRWTPALGGMERLEGTTLWYRTETLDRSARLDYKFVLPGSWILDPRNPHRAPSGFGENSELRMPGYIPPKEIEQRPNVPHGTLVDTLFASERLGNKRKVTIYLPAGYAREKDLPLILVHDGEEYIRFARMNDVLDNLIADGKIRPVIGLFVPPVDRSAEYDYSKQERFRAFIVEELIPFVDATYRTERNPSARATIGSSSGADIALSLGFHHPGVFGKVGLFSPFIGPELVSQLDAIPSGLCVYICHGTYDHLAPIGRSIGELLPILRSKSMTHRYEEYPEGHSYGLWRAHLDDALRMFFGKVTRTPAGTPGGRFPPGSSTRR